MKNKLVIVVSSFMVVLFFLCIPATVLAAEIKNTESYTLAKEETIPDNLIIYANTITLEGTVEGDVIAASPAIQVNGHIAGDLIALSNTLVLADTAIIDGNIRFFGTDAKLAGTISGNVYIRATQVETTAHIVKSFQATSNSIILGGSVDGGSRLDSPNVEFSPNGATLGGTTTFLHEMEEKPSNVTINGPIDFISRQSGWWNDLLRKISNAFESLITSFFFGFILLLFAPRILYALQHGYKDGVGMHFIRGIGMTAIILLVAFGLMFTGVGVPVALTLTCFVIIGLYIAHIIVSFWFGLYITKIPPVYPNSFRRSLLALLVGLTIYYAVSLVPILDYFLIFFVMASGFGSILKFLNDARKSALKR